VVVNTSTCEGCEEGSLTLHVWGTDNCTTPPLQVTRTGIQAFEKELGDYNTDKGCYQFPLDVSVSEAKITWDRKTRWRTGSICVEWMDSKMFPRDCKVRVDGGIGRCRKNKDYPERKCPTSSTVQSSNPAETTMPETPTTSTPAVAATVQSGHTLLRRIVVDTSSCKGCEGGSMTVQVWGADDARTVHNCTTPPLRVTGKDMQAFEKKLGDFTRTRGCHKAPLDASVSEGRVTWDRRVKWRSGSICFEWLDDHKFPLDCKVQGHSIGSCKINTGYPNLKCPTV